MAYTSDYEAFASEKRLFFGNSFEKGLDFLRPGIAEFLKMYAPNRVKMLKRILKKLGFKWNGMLLADLTMPMNVGGYYAVGMDIIAINPWLLIHGSERAIAHVLVHEGLHAGVFTDGEVSDESLTETMTKKMMTETYGSTGIRSGYDQLVDDAAEFFGDMSYQEMHTLVEDGDEETFNNILEIAVVNPTVESESIDALGFEEIQGKLKKYWKLLSKLFPRMINSIAGNGAGVHDEAMMAAHAFKLEGLLEKVSRQIFGDNQHMLNGIFEEIYVEVDEAEKTIETQDIIKQLFKKGLGYLNDFEPEVMKRMIEEFLDNKRIEENVEKAKNMPAFTGKNFDFQFVNLNLNLNSPD